MTNTEFEIQNRLKSLEQELNQYLAEDYKIDRKNKKVYEKWLESHRPFHWCIEFFDITQRGGFDVIIGNPPYVEYSKVKKEYVVRGFETESCEDLYAFVQERAGNVQSSSGRTGFIVPISFVSAEGFKPLRAFTYRQYICNWFSTYAMRPAKLFDGADKHLCIWVGRKVGISEPVDTAKNFCAKYHRWLSEERLNLFSLIEYAKIPLSTIYMSSIPKIGSNIAVSIFSKVLRKMKIAGQYVSKNGKYKFVHTRKLRYFLQFLDSAPLIYTSAGDIRVTSELKELKFDSEPIKDTALAAYCSTLFYWYYLTYSDCRNVNKREVYNFPVELDILAQFHGKQLTIVCKELMRNLQDNSTFVEMAYKKYGLLKVQVFSPRLSKVVVDRIDQYLGKYYGFSEEEVDFIINYDIKYRVGVNDTYEEDDSED